MLELTTKDETTNQRIVQDSKQDDDGVGGATVVSIIKLKTEAELYLDKLEKTLLHQIQLEKSVISGIKEVESAKEKKSVKQKISPDAKRILICANAIDNTPLEICCFWLYFFWIIINTFFSIYGLIIWINMYQAWWIDLDYENSKTLIKQVCNYDNLFRYKRDEDGEKLIGKASFGNDILGMVITFPCYIFILLLFTLNRTIVQRYYYNRDLSFAQDVYYGIGDIKLTVTVGIQTLFIGMYIFFIVYNANYFVYYHVILKDCDKNSSIYKSVNNSSLYYYLTIVNFVFNGVSMLIAFKRMFFD